VSLAGWAALAWSLRGLYDGIALLALVGSVERLRARSWSRSLFLYACALFLHFRALWYLPVAAAAAAGLAREAWSRRSLPPADRAWLAACVPLLAVTGMALAPLLPWLPRFPANNEYLWTSPAHPVAFGLLAAGILAGVGGAFATGNVLLGSTAALAAAVILSSPQSMGWHSLFLLPLPLLVRPASPAATRRAVALAVAASLVFARVVFRTDPLSLAVDQLGRLIHGS
jgi:hypothetical protein